MNKCNFEGKNGLYIGDFNSNFNQQSHKFLQAEM